MIHYVLQRKLYNLVPDVRHHFQIAKMKVYKTYDRHITQFCCFKTQKRVEKQGLNQPEILALQRLFRFMALISTLRGPKIARSVSLERKFDSLQCLPK